ncbi:MAG TPA: MBL fold metallo-hydrolase [Aliidongia sp.]|uniref:MBL fold metallo-hydrolase n=1 Tax=Aliidongia sp. TaxID=1914230 RepID=UPI002DDCD85F|nr:MBL fold metallo-hydrolase [Aliidongia sp.]HEV2675902.1 MBL fold metallo-hydrolase [Aliidongia sp.]
MSSSSPAAAAAGLTFPQATPPEPGGLVEIAPGVLWLRLALPFALNHVNIYLIEDDGGWAVLDTGLGDDETRAAWEAVLAGPLAGSRLTRLIVTHFHPDHVGLAGWLCERHGLALHMSQTEYLFSLSIQLDRAGTADEQLRVFHRTTGLNEEQIEQVVGRGHSYLKRTTGLPPTFLRLMAGDRLDLGGRGFDVSTGGGHAPEQVMLFQPESKLFFSADQVLAKISPNVSVWSMEPEADPLGLYLSSLAEIRATLPEDAFVVACHNLPFYGLHRRIDELAAHHQQRCGEILDACRAEPKSAADIIPILFRRPLDAHQTGFAVGEVVAHLNYMMRRRELSRETGRDGIHLYRVR